MNPTQNLLYYIRNIGDIIQSELENGKPPDLYLIESCAAAILDLTCGSAENAAENGTLKDYVRGLRAIQEIEELCKRKLR